MKSKSQSAGENERGKSIELEKKEGREVKSKRKVNEKGGGRVLSVREKRGHQDSL